MKETIVDGRTYAAFAATVIIGGSNFVAVSFSNQGLPPLFGATIRFGLAAILFFLIAQVTGVPRPTGREVGGAVVYGLLGFGAAYALLYYALVGLPAGNASLILAAVPLITHVIAVILGQEQLSARSVIGGLLVIAGIVVLSAGSLAGAHPASYLIAAVLASVVVSASGVAAKSLPEVHPVNMNAYGMAAGTILLAASSLVRGEGWHLPQDGQTWLAVGWLAVLGSVGLFQLFLFMIKRWTASATVYSVAAMPLVAVTLGAIVLDQPITSGVLIGGAMVLGAVYIGAMAGSKSSTEFEVDPASWEGT
jgi:drug/metabolite transporter (DMT)-like permease